MRFNRLTLIILFLGVLSPLRAGADTAGPRWAHELSDIPVSPRLTFGRLDNGLRYALAPNQTPPGQVSLRLLVLAGSLHERDDELGYAHFVEHMAFRSTRSFPADGKVRFLQGLGAGFGPHANAETTFTHTLYKLDLPENSAATLDGGLRILRDFADGLVFDQTEMDRERGVVLSEALAGHNQDQNRDVARLEFFLAGTRIPRRWPIGTEASIKKAGRAGLQAFYDAWYRPENMVIVVTGDIDPRPLAASLQAAFGSLSARTTPRPAPVPGTLAPAGGPTAKFLSEPRNGIQAELGTVRLEPLPPDTTQYRVKSIRLEIANRMLRQRLNRLTNQPKPPITAFNVDEGQRFGGVRQLTIMTVGDDYKWPTVLATAEQELRRALEYGFDESELIPVREAFRTEIEQQTRLAVTTPTEVLAGALATRIEEGRVFTFPDERLPQVLAIIDQLTLDDCRQALREAWGDSPRYVFLTASSAFIKPTTKQILAKYRESQAAAVAPASTLAAVEFAYEDFGPPGEVVAKEHVADLDLWLVRFANGVRLNLKRTDFEHHRVRFGLRLGTGRLAEPVDRPGLSLWTGPATFFGGLRKHTDDELARALSGNHINFDFSSGDDAFQISATAAGAELPMALRYVAAFVTDAAFRPEGDKRLAGNMNDTYTKLEQSAYGVIAQQITPFLAGGDPRIGFPPRKVVQDYSMKTMGAWFRPTLQTGAIEIALVGDFNVDEAIAQVARTLGALPPRAAKPDLADRRNLPFPVPPQSRTYAYYTSAKDRPVTLAFYWPVHEPVTAAEKKRLQLLAAVLRDRLRVQIRVDKGETYTPVARFDWNDAHPGFASLTCQIDVRAEQVAKLGKVVRELASTLGKNGVTAEELAQAKALALAEVRRWQRDNDYWISAVLADAQEHPGRLEVARTAEREVESATAAEIDALAARYLTDKNLFRFTIKPEYHRQ